MGEFLIEDLLVVSPDIIELKRVKEQSKEEAELVVN